MATVWRISLSRSRQFIVPFSSIFSPDFVVSSKMASIKRNHEQKIRFYSQTTIDSGDKMNITSSTRVKNFLVAEKLNFEQGFTCFVLNCILCPHMGKNVIHAGKLYINIVTGMFLCPTCRVSGTWKEFEDYVTILKREKKIDRQVLKKKAAPDWQLSDEGKVKIDEVLAKSIPMENLSEDKFNEITMKFYLQGINQNTMKKFNIHLSNDEQKILFPVYGMNGNVCAIRQLGLKEEKTEEKFIPKHANNFLFGWQRIATHHKKLILTTSPRDTLIASQELNIPSLSLPKGIQTLPVQSLPLLEQFNWIVFWFGGEVAAWEAARMFARKLGESRCHFVRPKETNLRPFEALRNNLNLSAILKDTHPVGHKAITSFPSLREEVFAEFFHVEQVAGIKWKRYPHLNKLLKGHRRGELTVITGPTGSGKTTFISEYSLDLCTQGVSTLWGSFEIRNVRLAKMMLIQFSQINLETKLDVFDEWADKFEQLPLHFLRFHGEESIKNVIAAMSHAVYVHDIQHIIVDNLQFMMGMNEKSSVNERFLYQDIIVGAFRKFASMNNVHVTLVIHPRKEKENELNISSIFGGAKASQEADNILILQDKRLTSIKGRKYLQVCKNRYAGDLGIVPLEFSKETLSFSVKDKTKRAEHETQERKKTEKSEKG